MFHITAIDLYGNTVYTDTIPLTYSNTAAYYQQITDKVKDFIDKTSIRRINSGVPSLPRELLPG